MDMQNNKLEPAKYGVIKKYKRKSYSSISLAFRNIRNKNLFPYIGDYPLLQMLIATSTGNGQKLTRSQITYAINQAGDLKGLPKHVKNALLNELQGIEHGQRKTSRFPRTDKRKFITVNVKLIKQKK